jgi:hypothetical protein
MKKHLIIIAFAILTFDMQAQGVDPTPPTPPPTTNVPVDGGISGLIAAGIAYGAKKLHDRRKKL